MHSIGAFTSIKEFSNHRFERVLKGKRFLIAKDSYILSNGESRLAKKCYWLKFNHMYSGHIDSYSDQIRNPRIVWPGAGSYWTESDVNNFIGVELIKA